MADILASIRILPTDITVNLNQLRMEIERSVPDNVKVQKSQEEPIAFGLVALIVHVTMPEKEEGIMTRLEEKLTAVKGVGEIQVVGMTRL